MLTLKLTVVCTIGCFHCYMWNQIQWNTYSQSLEWILVQWSKITSESFWLINVMSSLCLAPKSTFEKLAQVPVSLLWWLIYSVRSILWKYFTMSTIFVQSTTASATANLSNGYKNISKPQLMGKSISMYYFYADETIIYCCTSAFCILQVTLSIIHSFFLNV